MASDRAAKWRSGETSQERCQCCGNRAGRISREFRSTSVIRPAATSTCAACLAGTRAKRRPFSATIQKDCAADYRGLTRMVSRAMLTNLLGCLRHSCVYSCARCVNSVPRLPRFTQRASFTMLLSLLLLQVQHPSSADAQGAASSLASGIHVATGQSEHLRYRYHLLPIVYILLCLVSYAYCVYSLLCLYTRPNLLPL